MFCFYLFEPIKEIPENGSDVNHLDQLHSTPILTGADIRFNSSGWCHVVKHRFTAEWNAMEEEEKHVGSLKLMHALILFGHRIPGLDFHLRARQVCIKIHFLIIIIKIVIKS